MKRTKKDLTKTLKPFWVALGALCKRYNISIDGSHESATVQDEDYNTAEFYVSPEGEVKVRPQRAFRVLVKGRK